MLSSPARHLLRRRQFRPININHTGIRPTQLFHPRQRLRVNLLCNLQPLSTGRGQADQFFQPRRARGLQMQACACLLKSAIDDRIQRKLITPRMDAQFQIRRKAEFLDCKGDHGQIIAEFFFKLPQVPEVIDAFIKSPRELGRDRLKRNFLLPHGRQDEQQLHWCLRRIRLIHRYLGNKITALRRGDIAINLPRLLNGVRILPSNRLHACHGHIQTC